MLYLICMIIMILYKCGRCSDLIIAISAGSNFQQWLTPVATNQFILADEDNVLSSTILNSQQAE